MCDLLPEGLFQRGASRILDGPEETASIKNGAPESPSPAVFPVRLRRSRLRSSRLAIRKGHTQAVPESLNCFITRTYVRGPPAGKALELDTFCIFMEKISVRGPLRWPKLSEVSGLRLWEGGLMRKPSQSAGY